MWRKEDDDKTAGIILPLCFALRCSLGVFASALSFGGVKRSFETGAEQLEMKVQSIAVAATALPLAVEGVNVLVSNDDGLVS